MKRLGSASKEMRDSVLALGAALVYLASAVIDPLISLVLFFVFIGTAAALIARAHLKNPESAPLPGR